jgi:UDP-N-acetyl-D-mannosaminuronate dehydrogenase
MFSSCFTSLFTTLNCLNQRGAQVFVHDPLYSDEELLSLGFKPFHKGETAEVAIIQADHLEYKNWSYRDIPGIEIMMDGRDTIDKSNWQKGCRIITIGN